MTTEKKSTLVNGVEVKHPVEHYMLHVPSGTVVARSPTCLTNGFTSGTVVEQDNGYFEKGHFSKGWSWADEYTRWRDVTEEWRTKEQQEPKTPVQKREPTLSVLDEVALKLLPTIYQIADADAKDGSGFYSHDDWPTGLVQDAYRLAEAFMEVKLARDNKPVDSK